MAKPAELKHLAIIMDGNGRWASNQNLPRIEGHKRGAQATIDTINYCHDLGVKELSIFGLSTENTSRPSLEVSFIQDLVKQSCQNNQENFQKKGVRVKIIGTEDGLDKVEGLRRVKNTVESLTQHNQTMRLNILFNYSGRWEIENLLSSLQNNKAIKNPKEYIQSTLMQGMSYEPDLCIRTGGEMRLSNFMLWQLAYTELYFTNVLWPDFGRKDLDDALKDFYRRKRRFGQIES